MLLRPLLFLSALTLVTQAKTLWERKPPEDAGNGNGYGNGNGNGNNKPDDEDWEVTGGDGTVGGWVSPCDASAPVSCLRCKHATDDADCERIGTWETCANKHICYKFEKATPSGKPWIDRGCKPIPACEIANLGPGSMACSKQQEATNCLSCDFPDIPETCDPPKMATCSCHGDPHCQQFNQPEESDKALEFHGSCIYTMATDGCGGADATWTVLANFGKATADPTNPATFVTDVILTSSVGGNDEEVRFEAFEIYSSVLGGYVTDMSQVPIDGDIHVDIHSLKAIAKMPGGVVVTWNNNHQLKIDVPEALQGSVCGLCGAYTGSTNTDGDLDTLGPFSLSGECPAISSPNTPENMFASSWMADKDQDAECEADCNSGLV